MEICELKRGDEKAWDEYVLNHPDSTFYHQIGWKYVVEKSYGHKPCYLFAKEDGEVKGVLPLFFMRSLLFGKKLVSVPFAPYGGAVGDSRAIEELLVGQAIQITKDVTADYMELRNNMRKDSKLATNTNYMTLVLKLDKDPEFVWKGFNNKVRNAIRRSLNSEPDIRKGSIEEFYKLYSRNLKDLGTPTHCKDFFNTVISEFKGYADILTVKQNNEPVAAAIVLYFKDTVISGWAASDRKYSNLNPNNLLYWKAIKSACENGYKFFDFGRSVEGSGTYRFKKPWGAEPNQLFYSYYLNYPRKHIPDTSVLDTRRKLFTRLYKKVPLPIANLIGPGLRRNFA